MERRDALDHCQSTEPFEERLGTLVEELSAAVRGGRPSIVLAIYRSELVRREVLERLAGELARIRQGVVSFPVTRRTWDIPLLLRDHPARAEAVFSVRGLRWGGGRGHSNSYRALNMHREVLVEAGLRVLFWLTEREARLLPRYAPDFWAFRHRVIEFLDLPGGQALRAARADYQAGRPVRAPGSPALLVARGRLAARLGLLEEALGCFRRASRLDPHDLHLLALTAEVCLDDLQPEAAARLLRVLDRVGRPEPALWLRTARAYELLGEPARAGRAFARAGLPKSRI